MKKIIGIVIIFSLCFTGCDSSTVRKNKERKTEIYSIENNEELFEESINNDLSVHYNIFYSNPENSLPDDSLPERKLYIYQNKNFFGETYELTEIITTFQHDGYIKKEIISNENTQVFYYSRDDNIIF